VIKEKQGRGTIDGIGIEVQTAVILFSGNAPHPICFLESKILFCLPIF
jgi:hypothetical protein